jgi:hypothetical protein
MSANFQASRLTENQVGLIVLLTLGIGLVAGFALAFHFDLWLAPPFVEYTPWIHLALAFAWLPVLIVYAIRRSIGWGGSLALFLGLGLLTVFYIFLMGPYLAGPVEVESSQCEQILLPNNRVCYRCSAQAIISGDPGHKEMKGSVGSVLVRPVRYPEGVCPNY